MKTKTSYITLAVSALLCLTYVSCDPPRDDDDNPTPTATYNCNGGRQAYMEIVIGSTTTHAPASGVSATGGVAIVKENGTDKTRLDMGFTNSTGNVFNLKVMMSNVVNTGTYTITDSQSPVIIVNNTGYSVKNMSVSFDELTNPRDNAINPDVDFYDKASGTFSGVYVDENNMDISFNGSFCADMEPR